ncbi:MAG TPA: D-alanine--D-alanine ligase, partial [Lacipirellulaceae bacterium]|nr:D-alanine--D-alanine ligase [Lacipirellulaceae bacterium]
MHIGFTYDLRSNYLAAGFGEEETAEFDQLGTIEAIDGALCELGHTVDRIGNARDLIVRLAAGDRWDLVFNICEGLRGRGREAQVPVILDVYEIPYTFADPAALCVCLDKGLTKTVLRSHGLPTPDWHVAGNVDEIERCEVAFPVIAKPLAEGTGKGIDTASKVDRSASLRPVCERLLRKYEQPVLIEQFLPGREFTVGLLGTADDAEVAGTLEILLRDVAEPGVYSYLNKEESESLCEYRLVHGSDKAVAESERIALAAWRAMNGRDAGRIDIRCNESGDPQIMEINPLAGMHPTHSDLPMLWAATGRDFIDLIGRVVDSARLRISDRA